MEVLDSTVVRNRRTYGVIWAWGPVSLLLVRFHHLPECTVHPLLSRLVAHLRFVDRQRSDPTKSKEWTNYMP
jgi:hypothetical protein